MLFRSTLAHLAQELLALAERVGEVTVIDYRDRLALGRNYVIEVLEYFDQIGFTQRRDNTRVVLDATTPEKRFGKPA